MPRNEGRTIVRPSFFARCSFFGMDSEPRGRRPIGTTRQPPRPRIPRQLTLLRRRDLRGLFGRLFRLLVDRFDLDDRLAFVRDRGHTIRKIEISHPDGIAGVNRAPRRRRRSGAECSPATPPPRPRFESRRACRRSQCLDCGRQSARSREPACAGSGRRSRHESARGEPDPAAPRE